MNIYSKNARLILIAFTSMTLFACTLIKPSPDSLNQDIKHWLSQNEFDEIEDALEKIDKDDKTFKSIIDTKPTIKLQKKKFIENTSSIAHKHKQSNEWQQALDTYNNALQKIENEPRLIKEKGSLLRERDKRVTALRKDMLMKRADALISYKMIYEKLHNLIPDDYSAQFDINRYEGDRLDVANHLRMCGDQARRNKQYTIARDCYFLSNKLEPTKQKLQLVTQIDTQLKNNSNKKRQDELLTAYKSANGKQEFIKAQLHLNTLLAIDPSHKKANDLLVTLNKKLKDQALNKITLGKDLYSKKRINDALVVWQQALLLEPDNDELIQLITRAEKVSKKIQSLEDSQ